MLITAKSKVRIDIKVLKFKITGVTSLSLLVISTFSSAWGQVQPTRRDERKPNCQSIARILDGDVRLKAGSEVCKGEYLTAANGRIIEVFCFASANILQLRSGYINEQCSQQMLGEQAQPCMPTNRFNCFSTKGPNEENAPQLIIPYSPLIIDSRPTLSWTPTLNAISYIVEVKGTEVNWSKEVINSTTLLYPKDQPALQSTSIYQVNVLAKIGEQKFVPSSFILMRLSTEQERRIKDTITRLQSFNLPLDDLAVDINRVYKTNDLFTDAIEVLKDRVEVKNQNPIIHRELGDRYVDVGLISQAAREYQIAIKYAKLKSNFNELIKAQEKLEFVLSVKE